MDTTRMCDYKEIYSNSAIKRKPNSYIYLWRQVLVSSGVWLAFFGLGLATGACTVIIPQLKKEKNSTIVISEDMASWIAAGNTGGAFVAVFFTTILSIFVGRKPLFIFSAIATIISNIIFYFSVNSLQILISEIVQGINGACVLTIDLMILSEYTSSNYRGVFLTIKTAMMFWGIWVANAIGTFFHWRNIGIVGMFCGIYTLVVSLFWPESPYWLAHKKRVEECTKSQRWLKGQNDNTESELKQILKINKAYTNVTVNLSFNKKCKLLFHKITKKDFYKSTLISVVIICLYHSTGKYVFSVYAIDIMKKITEEERASYIAMLFLDGVTVLGMYIGCILSKFVKRRILLFSTSVVGILSLFAISGYLYLVNLSILNENKYLSVVLLTVFSLSVSMGPIVLSSSLIGELAPLKLRSLSFFITISINFGLTAFIVKIAPVMFTTLKLYGAFMMYGVLSSMCLYILYKYLPETKDKSLLEIRNLIMNSNNCQ